MQCGHDVCSNGVNGVCGTGVCRTGAVCTLKTHERSSSVDFSGRPLSELEMELNDVMGKSHAHFKPKHVIRNVHENLAEMEKLTY